MSLHELVYAGSVDVAIFLDTYEPHHSRL